VTFFPILRRKLARRLNRRPRAEAGTLFSIDGERSAVVTGKRMIVERNEVRRARSDAPCH
jgi:hypothetical protein